MNENLAELKLLSMIGSLSCYLHNLILVMPHLQLDLLVHDYSVIMPLFNLCFMILLYQ